MGSGSSRPASSAQRGKNPKRSARKAKENVLMPFLRSFSCGASSSWRTESFVQGNTLEATETQSCQSLPEKAVTRDVFNESCAPYELRNTVEEKLGHVPSDGGSSGHISRIPLQNSECSSFPNTEKLPEFSSRFENNCSGASDSNNVYSDRNSKNGQWYPEENEENLPAMPTRASSLDDTKGCITLDVASTDGASSFDTNSQQVDILAPLSCSHGMSSSDHEITVPDTFGSDSSTQYSSGDISNMAINSRTPSSSENVINMPTNTVNLEQGGSISSSEAVPGQLEGDTFLERDELAVANLLGGTSHASRSENLGVFPVEGLDLLSQSSGVSSNSSLGEASGREGRRNNRRRLWDALTRATSRRRTLSPTLLVASEDIDALSSWNGGWSLFDWNSISEGGGFADEGSFIVGRSSEAEERRWRVRPQVWALQHLSSGVEGGSGHSRHCALRRHPDGRCSCEAFVMTEETSTRASISRIVMLAEALFEVLDEMHRQSVALSRSTSLSLVSIPAPEVVVDSFPLRIHKKTEKPVAALEEMAECHICLIEYEDGDRVRTLPCHHEFHMTCVDKWLKEVHRVCPLCRGNVCDVRPGSSVPSVA